ncbi:hypothetical protein [Virgibacillus sp. JSM 102003]|uniref:hypothetical protein n=1 Tax=Virgibacillus sp. JSM 102003 TaxID=1562108 RepID=UPI0035BFB097
MAVAGNFNFDDMLVMNNVSETMSKMDEVLDAMVLEFTGKFGEPYTYDYERLKEIPKHNRYTLWKDDIFPGRRRSTDSKIILGFEFYQAETEAYPLLFLSVMCNKRNSSYQKVKDAVHAVENFDYIDDDEGGSVWGWYEKPLSDFLPVENQLADIKEWFVSRMEELQSFKEKTVELKWQV